MFLFHFIPDVWWKTCTYRNDLWILSKSFWAKHCPSIKGWS